MKKYIYASLFAVASMLAATSCEEDSLGSVVGSDTNPNVLVYLYDTELPNNPDNDVQIRFVANNQVETAYYLVEKTADAESHGLGTDAYADYVVANGSKLEVTDDKAADLLITDLYGPYSISLVGVKGNKKSISTQEFVGLDWETVSTGSFIINFAAITNLYGAESVENVELQVCTTNSSLYRLKNLFAEGYSIKLDLLPSYTATDEDGTYTYMRIKPQAIGLSHPTHGACSIRDIGYWQGDSSWITDSGYESGMYNDYSCFIVYQMYVSAGSFGYATGYFIPNE